MKLKLFLLPLITVAYVGTLQSYMFAVNNKSSKFKISGAVVELTNTSGCQNMYMQEPPNGPSPLMPGQSWSDHKDFLCSGICLKDSILLRIGLTNSSGQAAYWYNLHSDSINSGFHCSNVNVDVLDDRVVISNDAVARTFMLDGTGKPSGDVSGPV